MNRRIDIHGEDRLDNVDYSKLIHILMLMEANSHLSASRSGLEKRHKNRDEALQQIIKVSDN